MDIRTDPAAWVRSVIGGFLDRTSENFIWAGNPERAWGDPVIGFSRGSDPIYQQFKDHIGPFHWTPSDAFELAFPEKPACPDELTVISWILPQTRATRIDNRKQKDIPAERWARTRTFGELVNEKLRRHVVSSLQEAGHDAMAPVLSPAFTWQDSPGCGFSSTWSERHAAFASGLGTFGLCQGLITPVGKAMRTGSVIARISIPPTKRPYTSHTEYCLFLSGRGCGKCMSRCPAGAITEQGHDKMKCFEYMMKTVIPAIKSRYGFDGYSCGLCQTKVPCEAGIPAIKDTR